MLTDRSRIREGMTVFSSDGEKLGKVLSCDASTFTIEKGLFFPKDYLARYGEIADVTGDDIRLSMRKDTFVHKRETAAEEDVVRRRPVVKEQGRLHDESFTERRAAPIGDDDTHVP